MTALFLSDGTNSTADAFVTSGAPGHFCMCLWIRPDALRARENKLVTLWVTPEDEDGNMGHKKVMGAGERNFVGPC